MPDETTELFDVWNFSREMQKVMGNHLNLLMQQYRIILGIYGGNDNTFREAMLKYWPRSSEYYEVFDRWIERQANILENITRRR